MAAMNPNDVHVNKGAISWPPTLITQLNVLKVSPYLHSFAVFTTG